MASGSGGRRQCVVRHAEAAKAVVGGGREEAAGWFGETLTVWSFGLTTIVAVVTPPLRTAGATYLGLVQSLLSLAEGAACLACLGCLGSCAGRSASLSPESVQNDDCRATV